MHEHDLFGAVDQVNCLIAIAIGATFGTIGGRRGWHQFWILAYTILTIIAFLGCEWAAGIFP